MAHEELESDPHRRPLATALLGLVAVSTACVDSTSPSIPPLSDRKSVTVTPQMTLTYVASAKRDLERLLGPDGEAYAADQWGMTLAEGIASTELAVAHHEQSLRQVAESHPTPETAFPGAKVMYLSENGDTLPGRPDPFAGGMPDNAGVAWSCPGDIAWEGTPEVYHYFFHDARSQEAQAAWYYAYALQRVGPSPARHSSSVTLDISGDLTVGQTFRGRYATPHGRCERTPRGSVSTPTQELRIYTYDDGKELCMDARSTHWAASDERILDTSDRKSLCYEIRYERRSGGGGGEPEEDEDPGGGNTYCVWVTPTLGGGYWFCVTIGPGT